MNNSPIKYAFLFIFLVLLQVLLLNNVRLWGYLNPILYILFIFLFPLNKDKTLFLILSFLLGLSIDFFSNSGGSNAAATLFIAYFRLPLLNIIQNNTEFDHLLFDVKKLNFFQAIIYIITLTFIHHSILFFLEYYKLSNFLSVIGTIITTVLFSSLLIAFSLSLFVTTKK